MALSSQSKWRSFLHKQGETTPGGEKRIHGLHTLVDQGHDVAEATDIVAIHGLNGHFFKTWTDSTAKFNWLRDAIPMTLPKARVMSFSYDSALQFSKSASDIFDFADQLLEYLLAERQSSIEQARPIVFICHSLGGIVFKQAMIRAFECERYTILLRNTIGVMFLATPHRGSAYANWATILARILNSGAFGSRTNPQLSKDIEPKSRVLEQISRSFVERTEGMAIVSFYETSKMDYAKSVIVEKDSACLGVRNEISIPLNGDHRTICKYRAEKHGDLRIILRNLKSLSIIDHKEEHTQSQSLSIEKQPVTEINPHSPNLLNRLETSSPEIHKARNPTAAKGTCTWLLRHPTYESWFGNPHSSFLWLSADPGCGKSVLASFLIDHFSSLTSSQRPSVCYFFFKSDNNEQKHATHALQAILCQLLRQRETLLKVVSSTLNEQRLDSLPNLWNAFIAAAEHPDTGDTICILDGLDECDMRSRKELAGLISTHFSRTLPSTSLKSSPRFKLLVASRPDTAFKILFDKPPRRLEPKSSNQSDQSNPQASMIRLRGEDEIEAITDDVSMVIKSDMEELEYQGLPSETLMSIQTQLIARADRTFLWVTLILALLKERVEAGASTPELDAILQSRDIDVLYSQLLSGRTNAPRARKVLNLVLAAHRPLTVEELSIALAIDQDNPHEWPQGPTSKLMESLTNFDKVQDNLIFPYENHIKSLCGHFVRIIRNRVYLVHETARTFLLATWKKPGPIFGSVQWEGTFEIYAAKYLLLNVCVTFLYCYARQSRCARIGNATPRTAPFIEYAATYWPAHFKEVQIVSKTSIIVIY
ncbi:hypothetical protein G7Z17_g4593 [Cylindrodendrum hubeiense]|uniref:NACHT domain-containing protein n=1 Tax=Cylindrodendrum hubeiense TaxID=595255 RepID=A0A9P5LH12_9HYPO|nr:hypothetical protein G7Z17_g4593 [Cylindrodendrum hubeiense]